MALRRRDQRVERVADAAARLAEAGDDVAAMSRVGEPLEPHRHRLAVQRPLLVLEQLAHQAGLRAGEDERRDLALELDVAAQERVHLLHLRDVLELVEHDQRAEAAALLEPQRQVEQRVQRRQRVGARVDLQPGADPERAERQAEAGALQELLDPACAVLPFSCRAYARSKRIATSAIESTP